MPREGLMDDTGYDFGASDDYYQMLEEKMEEEREEYAAYLKRKGVMNNG